MKPESIAVLFGALSTMLYLGWSISSLHIEDQRHMGGAMLFYACANVCLMWPVIKRMLSGI